MRTSDRSSKEIQSPVPPKQSAVILLLSAIADTTWRMFVPALAGIIGGYTLDTTYGTTPWLFAAGTVLGCSVAALLVRQQLEKKL